MKTHKTTLLAAFILATGFAAFAADLAEQAPLPSTSRTTFSRPPANKADAIERQNSKEDVLRGYTTYSTPEDRQFVAYVYLRWGDVDNIMRMSTQQFYRQWDGFLKVDGGAAEVVAKSPNYGNVQANALSPSMAKLDTVVTQKGPSVVEWRSAVSGSSAGVTVKLTLRAPAASGVLKAGNFTVPFKIAPLPPGAKTDAKAATDPAAAKPAAAQPAPAGQK
jgi:hypothetical protein